MTRATNSLSEALRGLDPGWFALTMATGIVGLAAHDQGIPIAPTVLLWSNLLFYAALWFAYLARLTAFPRTFFGDFRQHANAMGYFTIVAGTAVLGSQVLQVGGSEMGAKGLWLAALLLWTVLVYAIPVSLVTRREKPPLQEGVKGTWLVWAVATEAVSVLGAQVAPSFGKAAEHIVLVALLLWLFGGMLYMWVIELIIQRLFFSDLVPNQLSPTYWIGMGAVAISTLAGATLLQTTAHPLIGVLKPFIAGMTLVFWATGTWWIPWLLIIGIWRHVVMRHPAWYEPGWWGMVFPIGMYTVATATAAQALDLPVFAYIASGFVWLALAAWAGTFANMLITLSRQLLISKTA